MHQVMQMTPLMSLHHAYKSDNNAEKCDFVLFDMLKQNV